MATRKIKANVNENQWENKSIQEEVVVAFNVESVVRAETNIKNVKRQKCKFDNKKIEKIVVYFKGLIRDSVWL